MKISKYLLLPAFFLFLFSCSQRKTLTDITFETASLITVAERVALITDPYISFRDTPGPIGITISHGRRGEVYAVLGKKYIANGSATEMWYQLEKGWILSTSVQLFSSFARAQSTAKSFH